MENFEDLINRKSELRRQIANKRFQKKFLEKHENQLQNDIYNLKKQVKNYLAPKLKMYHNSKVNMGKRGGGGKNAIDNFISKKKIVEQKINNCGFDLVKNDEELRTKSYKKNIKSSQGFIIHFKLLTRNGMIINMILQTQSKNGGSSSKASFYVDSMAKTPNELYIFLFESRLESAKENVNKFIINDGKLERNVAYFNDLDSLERALRLI
jgi:hypothetical protein